MEAGMGSGSTPCSHISACNAIVVCSLSPSCLKGSTFPKLPNNIFEKSYPLMEFDMQKRIQSFIYKAAGLFTVGLVAGAVQGSLSKFLASRKKGTYGKIREKFTIFSFCDCECNFVDRSSVTIPSVGTNALRYGAFLGLFANLRCQILCGTDMLFKNHFDVIAVAQFFSLAMRILMMELGERSRPAWLGVEVDPLVNSDDFSRAYIRPAETEPSLRSSFSSKECSGERTHDLNLWRSKRRRLVGLL